MKIGKPLPYDTLDELRNRMEQIGPHLVNYGKREGASASEQLSSVHILLTDIFSERYLIDCCLIFRH